MRLRRLPGALHRIVGETPLAIDVAQRVEREFLRRDERRGLPLWINGSEVEQTVALNRTAKRGAGVTQLRLDGIHRAFDARHALVIGFESVRTDIRKRA